MRNIPLVRRLIRGALHQSLLFILSVALSLVTLVSLGGFSRSVHSSFLRDARALHAADIIIHSHTPFSGPLLSALRSLESRTELELARIHEFYSVVRTARKLEAASILAHLKVVDPGYPFYGSVELASGRAFREALAPGSVIVERSLLDRLHMRVGDRLRAGGAVFRIADVVLQEPDRPVNFFSIGPRVFVAAQDLAKLDLIGKGSRVNYLILGRVRGDQRLEEIAGRLRAAADRDRERIETYRTAESGVKRFFDNFLFFLNLIGIFTLLLAGIGIQSSLTALLKEQEQTIAVMKAVGAGRRFIYRAYYAVAALLGLVGTALGIGASFALEHALPALFTGLLPAAMELHISGAAVAEGVVLGVIVVALFTYLPLALLNEVRPRAIFGKEERHGPRGGTTRAIAAGGALFFFALVLWRVGEARTGLYFLLGVIGLIVLAAACTELMLRGIRRLQMRNLVVRQALRGLFRPRNATRVIITTLSASLAVIFSITLVEENLDQTFVRSYPPDAPNLFFIDIQRDQKKGFEETLGTAATFYPVVRGSVMAINQEPIDREIERSKRGDNLAREFNLTYRETLLEDERIVSGTSLFRSDWRGVQVSVLDTVVKMRTMRVGDLISFRIQGVPVDARISSIRTRTRAAIQPFFYFVFPEAVLVDAPQTLFTAARVQRERIPEAQNRVLEKFPNISVINVSETIAVFSRIMSRLSMIVRFFTFFSSIAGGLLIVSSVFATRRQRVREAVYFTILGARSRFVLGVFAVESLVLGLASGLIALALAETAAWVVCRFGLDIAYWPAPGLAARMAAATVLAVVGVGLAASASVIRRKPAEYLRERAEE